MSTSFFEGKREVELNGLNIDHVLEVTIGNINKVFDSYEVIANPFTHDIEIAKEASGSFKVIASDKINQSSQSSFLDLMQMILGYRDLDVSGGTTDSISNTMQDWTEASLETAGNWTGKRTLVNFLRIDDLDGAGSTMDATTDRVAFRFKAMGEAITALELVNKQNTGVATLTCELFTDTLTGPNTKVGTSLTDSVDDATFKWRSLSTPSDWSSLTVGNYYWIVCSVSADGVILGFNTDTSADYGGYLVNSVVGPIASFADAGGGQVTVGDVGHTLSNGDVVTIYGTTNYNGRFTVANVAADTFEITATYVVEAGAGNWVEFGSLQTGEAIYKITFQTDEGLNLVVYDYDSPTSSTGHKWSFPGIKISSISPETNPKQATRGSWNWEANDWTYATF